MNDPVSISTDNKATVVRIGAVSILSGPPPELEEAAQQSAA